MAHKLVITITFENEEESVKNSKRILSDLYIYFQECYKAYISNTIVALVREGDRSAGNLLLEPLEGRFGRHLQGRKAKLSEVI